MQRTIAPVWSAEVAAASTGLPEEPAGQAAARDSGLDTRQLAAGCPVCGSQPPGPHPAGPAGRALVLAAWLAENYHRPDLRAGQIAAAIGVSVRRLQVLCKRDFGRTPMELLADIRLCRAHLALTSPHAAALSPGEVARSI